MAERLPTSRMLPSLIDRLTDSESMGGVQAGYDHRQMLASVRNDLEDLLNTRRTTGKTTGYPEVDQSIVAYGLPDLNAFDGTSREQCRELARAIEEIIARYEPRLRKVRVRAATGPEHGAVAVRFQIDAELNVDPAPEIGFETVLELTTGKAIVQSSEGAV